MRAGPDFSHEAGSERGDLVQVECAVCGRVAHVCWEPVGAVVEVLESQGGYDGDDDIVMRHVHVERLVERELGRVVVVGVVDARVAGIDQFRLQTRGEFQHVANSLGTTGGRAEAVVAVELEVDHVLVVAPFLLREERAECGTGEAGRLVHAEILHRKHVQRGEVEIRWKEAR